MAEGLNVAMYGMGIVFLFLTLLVGVTMLMSSAILKLSGPEPSEAATQGPQSEDAVLLAAAAAAVHRYRQDHS